MSVISTRNLSALKIIYTKGFGDNNKMITTSKTYNYIDPEATDENIHEVGKAIAALQKHTLSNMVRVDNTGLSE